MGVALHKPADNNGHGFVHTYGLMNGRGYHMHSHLQKWAWIHAYLHTDEWTWLPCLQTVIYVSGRGSRKKQSYAMTYSNTSTFNLACGVRLEESVKQDLDDPTRFNIVTNKDLHIAICFTVSSSL